MAVQQAQEVGQLPRKQKGANAVEPADRIVLSLRAPRSPEATRTAHSRGESAHEPAQASSFLNPSYLVVCHGNLRYAIQSPRDSGVGELVFGCSDPGPGIT